MKIWKLIRPLLLGCGCVAATHPSAAESTPRDVSLIELIAEPSAFDGKVVQVVGFVHFEFEGNQICLHREDLAVRLSRNCLWLSDAGVSDEKLAAVNDHYAIVIGRFNAKSHGHLGMFSGELEEVSRLDTWGAP